jgi:hypothetical protein
LSRLSIVPHLVLVSHAAIGQHGFGHAAMFEFDGSHAFRALEVARRTGLVCGAQSVSKWFHEKARLRHSGCNPGDCCLCGSDLVQFFRQEMIGQFFANQKAPAQTVSTIDVKPQTWTPGISAIGTARAAQGVQLAVQASGIVRQIAFEANEKVAKDQLVVQLDDSG